MELSTSQYGKPIRCDLSNLGYVTTSKQILMVRIIIPFVEFTHQFGSCLPTLKLLAIRSHEEVLRESYEVLRNYKILQELSGSESRQLPPILKKVACIRSSVTPVNLPSS